MVIICEKIKFKRKCETKKASMPPSLIIGPFSMLPFLIGAFKSKISLGPEGQNYFSSKRREDKKNAN